MPVIKTLDNGTILEYDSGKFDKWCVYVTKPGGRRIAPRDIDYFNEIISLTKKYDKNKIFNDICKVAQYVSKVVDKNAFEQIHKIAESYHAKDEVEIMLCTIYMAMISEENRAHTKLGKRIKLLGIYQVIFEGYKAWDAANYSKERKWTELSDMCKERGF